MEGAELRARTAKGERRGADFAGAELSASLEDGSAALVRIESVEQSDRPGFQDVYRYVVSYEAGGGRAYLCGTDGEGRPVRAIPLAGRWSAPGASRPAARVSDPGSFTFACEGAALAKCVYLGYRPWAGSVRRCAPGGACREVALSELHQACTRMIRADYCGDGESYTKDGTLIDIYDGVGIQTDTEDWPVEAEWTAAGARCLHRMRLRGAAPPPCVERLRLASCGDPRHFGSGTLIITESPGP